MVIRKNINFEFFTAFLSIFYLPNCAIVGGLLLMSVYSSDLIILYKLVIFCIFIKKIVAMFSSSHEA